MSITRLRPFLAALALCAVLALAGCQPGGTPEPSPNAASSTGLVEAPKEYNGDKIDFAGEAIGEAMERGEMTWLHINDDAYYKKNVEEGAKLGGYNTGMAVWISTELAEGVEFFGDYKHEGDIIEVTGTFNAACGEHGGDMDIHATALTVLVPGHTVIDEVRPWKLFLALALGATALLLSVIQRVQKRSV